jgi:hypothetical protein
MRRLASRGLARVLREWRRVVGAPMSLQGWMDRSRARSAAFARSIIFNMPSFIKTDGQNIRKKGSSTY